MSDPHGLIRAGLSITKGEDARLVGMLFSTDQLGPYILASIIVGAIRHPSGSSVLHPRPDLRLFFAAVLRGTSSIDKTRAPIDSIKASFTLVNENLGIAVLLIAWSSLVVNVRHLRSWPSGVTYVASGLRVRRCNGEPVAA